LYNMQFKPLNAQALMATAANAPPGTWESCADAVQLTRAQQGHAQQLWHAYAARMAELRCAAACLAWAGLGWAGLGWAGMRAAAPCACRSAGRTGASEPRVFYFYFYVSMHACCCWAGRQAGRR
jgi:hypothetical protein